MSESKQVIHAFDDIRAASDLIFEGAAGLQITTVNLSEVDVVFGAVTYSGRHSISSLALSRATAHRPDIWVLENHTTVGNRMHAAECMIDRSDQHCIRAVISGPTYWDDGIAKGLPKLFGSITHSVAGELISCHQILPRMRNRVSTTIDRLVDLSTRKFPYSVIDPEGSSILSEFGDPWFIRTPAILAVAQTVTMARFYKQN